MRQVNQNSDHKMINFNVPNYLINSFDNLVRFKRVSRTSMLVRLMEDYLRSEHDKMKEDGTLNSIMNDLSNRNSNNHTKPEQNDKWDQPMVPFFTSSEYDDWDNRF